MRHEIERIRHQFGYRIVVGTTGDGTVIHEEVPDAVGKEAGPVREDKKHDEIQEALGDEELEDRRSWLPALPAVNGRHEHTDRKVDGHKNQNDLRNDALQEIDGLTAGGRNLVDDLLHRAREVKRRAPLRLRVGKVTGIDAVCREPWRVECISIWAERRGRCIVRLRPDLKMQVSAR